MRKAIQLIGLLQLLLSLGCFVLAYLMWRADSELIFMGSYLTIAMVALVQSGSAIVNMGPGTPADKPPNWRIASAPLLYGALILAMLITPAAGRSRSHSYTEHFRLAYHAYAEPYTSWILLLGCVTIAAGLLAWYLGLEDRRRSNWQ